jgi:hypothetical protein
MLAMSFDKVHFNFDELPWLTNPRKDLKLEALALGLIRIPKGKGYSFTHKHKEQEEVYLTISGAGEILIDGELIEVKKGDVVRVSPDAKRALKASDHEDLFVICAGAVAAGYPKNPDARYLIDDGVPFYDEIPPWYEGDPEVKAKNAKLQARMEKARLKREGPA